MVKLIHFSDNLVPVEELNEGNRGKNTGHRCSIFQTKEQNRKSSNTDLLNVSFLYLPETKVLHLNEKEISEFRERNR